MKKFISMGICLLLAVAATAQIPSLPKPKPKTLPSPMLKVYQPADLQITNIQLVSITKNDAQQLYLINVSLTIKNTGELQSLAGKLKGFNTVAYHGYKAPGHPPMKDINDWNRNATAAVPSPWTVCSDEQDLPAVSGGSSISIQRQFSMANYQPGVLGAKFYFMVLADLYNSTKESHEDNNYSSAIFITPPAH